jgi:hypothetical protein
MSNNIYDILKKLSGLENPQQKKSVISESKKMCNECGMYESKCSCGDKKDESKKKDKVKEGAIAEAVAKVEAKLMEKWGKADEDMLSPKQKKIAKLSPPPDEIDAGDLAALRKGKKTNEGEMTPKQKKFAALAEPKDKITYADKIAGATKKVKEGFEDLEKYMKDKEGKTTHGKKTKTKTGLKHERDYDKEDNEKETGEEKKGRGRPKKDKFNKKDKD